MRGEDQVIAFFDIVAKLCDHRISVPGAGNDGVTVMPQHMCVNGVDPGDFYIKSIVCLFDDKINAADRYPAFFDHVGDFVYRGIKNFSECAGKIIDQGLAAAALGIEDGVFCGIFRNIGKEGPSCAVIGNEHSGDFNILKVFREFFVVVKETWGFNDDSLAVFFDDEHLIVNKIVGLVSMQLYAAEIVDIQFSFRECNCLECVLVHRIILLIII